MWSREGEVVSSSENVSGQGMALNWRFVHCNFGIFSILHLNKCLHKIDENTYVTAVLTTSNFVVVN